MSILGEASDIPSFTTAHLSYVYRCCNAQKGSPDLGAPPHNRTSDRRSPPLLAPGELLRGSLLGGSRSPGLGGVRVINDLLRLNGNSGALNGSSWVAFRAHSEGHKDSRIGGTSREIRRDAARRARGEHPKSQRQGQRRGFS